MPKSYPDFPHHTQIARVLQRLRRPLRLPRADPLRDRRRARRAARRTASGRSSGPTAGRRGATTRWSSPTATTGTRAGPSRPSPARFDGERDARPPLHRPRRAGTDKRVVVLGMGNSAMDIAVEASYVGRQGATWPRGAARTSSRSTSSAGRSTSSARAPARALLAIRAPGRARPMLRVRARGQHGGLRAAQARPPARRGAPDDLGPTSSTASPTATVTPEAEHRRARGRPRALRRRRRSSRPTSIVYCTGYKVTFPFFDEDFISAPDNDLPLFRRVFHPDIGNVFFLALLQPLGATMPIAEAPGRRGSPTTCAASTRCRRRERDAGGHRARARARCSSAT